MEPFHLHQQSPRASHGRVVSLRKGFTVIELVVVLAIITIITSIVLTSRTNFDNSVVLSNTAYDIALTIRNTQSYGFGSRLAGSTSNVGYGVHFTKSNQITVFADIDPGASNVGCNKTTDPTSPAAHPGDCVYTESMGEKVQTYTITNGVTVTDLRVYTGGVFTGGTSFSSIDLTSARPNTDFKIARNSNPNGINIKSNTGACIAVTSKQKKTRTILVTASGVITVSSATACP